MSNREEILMSSIEAGVRCIVPKDAPVDVLLETISDITNGNSGTRRAARDADTGNKKSRKGSKSDTYSRSTFLTDREMEIIGLMIKGYNPKKISGQLGISIRTVEFHKYKILKKCNLHSTSEVIHFVLSNKILPY
jgi:DNA-binding NarL/FixJ family response regulator